MALVTRRFLGTGVLMAAVIAGPFGPEVSSADPIKVTFTVFPSPVDPFTTGPSTGSFTFDSGRVPFRGAIQDTLDDGGLASDIFLRWGSTVWTTANAGVWLLSIDRATGQLNAWGLGGPQSGGIIRSPAEDVVDLVSIVVDNRLRPSTSFEYTYQGRAGGFEGRVEWSQFPAFTPVPEPGTLVLVASGTFYLIRLRARRRSAAS